MGRWSLFKLFASGTSTRRQMVGSMSFEGYVKPDDLIGRDALLEVNTLAAQFHGMNSSAREAGHPHVIFLMTSAV